MSNVIITGGGAAGMMAAYAAAERGHSVVLIEKNEKLGKKIFITGKGRCNVTNACEQDKLFENVVSNPKFLYSAFYDFDNQQLMELIKNAGCPLKVERGERVFPVSDHSSDIIAAMERLMRKKGVEIRLHRTVSEVLARTGDRSKDNGRENFCGGCRGAGYRRIVLSHDRFHGRRIPDSKKSGTHGKGMYPGAGAYGDQ